MHDAENKSAQGDFERARERLDEAFRLRVRLGLNAEAAATLNQIGLIALDASGEAAIEFNTQVFHRAVASGDGVRTAVAADWR